MTCTRTIITDEYINSVRDTITHNLGKGHPIVPIVHVVSETKINVIGFIPKDTDGPDGRNQLVKILRHFNADAFIFLCEAIGSVPSDNVTKESIIMLYVIERNMPAEIYVGLIDGDFDEENKSSRSISKWVRPTNTIDFMGIIVEEW